MKKITFRNKKKRDNYDYISLKCCRGIMLVRIIGSAIILAIIIAEKVKTNVSWLNIIKSEFGTIFLVILIGIIVEVLITIFKD